VNDEVDECNADDVDEWSPGESFGAERAECGGSGVVLSCRLGRYGSSMTSGSVGDGLGDANPDVLRRDGPGASNDVRLSNEKSGVRGVVACASCIWLSLSFRPGSGADCGRPADGGGELANADVLAMEILRA